MKTPKFKPGDVLIGENNKFRILIEGYVGGRYQIRILENFAQLDMPDLEHRFFYDEIEMSYDIDTSYIFEQQMKQIIKE